MERRNNIDVRPGGRRFHSIRCTGFGRSEREALLIQRKTGLCQRLVLKTRVSACSNVVTARGVTLIEVLATRVPLLRFVRPIASATLNLRNLTMVDARSEVVDDIERLTCPPVPQHRWPTSGFMIKFSFL